MARCTDQSTHGARAGHRAADWRLALNWALLATSTLLTGTAVNAQDRPSTGIYTCVDERGRRLTSDRPIAECVAREQHLLNRDGSVRTVIPPTLTAEERAEREVRDRKAAEARAAQNDAVRRDRNLMARYRNEEAHGKAREAALEPARLAQRGTERRLKDLAAERVPLLSEAEFYPDKRKLPPRLKQQLDANEAAVDAQQSAAATQAAEIDRINRFYDAELERLRRLWSGAQPGSLGPIQPVAGAPAVEVTTPPVAPAKASAPAAKASGR